jgi:hypothetical protein
MSLKRVPAVLTSHEAFAPILSMCQGLFLTSAEVGERYKYTEEHLCNLRRAGRGWPFIKLDSGGIRYRLSELLAAELRGTTGPLTLERVEQALAACDAVPLEHRAAMQKHLRSVFGAW